jgi:hypothetical protein
VRWLYLALFAIGLAVYGIAACGRVWKQSSAPHFVYQAEAWLSGSIAIAPNCGPCGPDDPCEPPPRPCGRGESPLPADDWATVETVETPDGRVLRGRRLVVQRFQTVDGRELPISWIAKPLPGQVRREGGKACVGERCWEASEVAEVALLHGGEQVIGKRVTKFRLLGGDEILAEGLRSRGYTTYVSFPVVPAVLMLPSAAIAGRAGNDVIPTLLVAALILPLTLLVLRRLAEAGHSTRSVREDLWLVGMLAFGSVLFFASIQGKVWYTAHVVGVALALVYAWASIEARHPVVAGLALGTAALTRTSMAFMFPLFLYEAWRIAARATASEVPAQTSASMDLAAGRRAMLRAMRRPLLAFAAPIVVFAIAGMIYNQVRFESLTEFGHSYLALGDRTPVRQQLQIEQWGLASYHYLARNLSVALTLLPELVPHKPWVQISGHGLALWVTTPALLLLVWPRRRGPLHLVLWLTVLFVALPSLLYMNTGWVQFGYRFSLDYMVFLVMLLAIGDRPLGRVGKTLIVIGVIVNLFGAWSFDRRWEHYRVGGKAYETVVGV